MSTDATCQRRSVRFLLLQVRNADDPMRHHEIRSFARSLCVDDGQIQVFDLLSSELDEHHYADIDVFLLGGSGHYSATVNAAWLDRALQSLRLIYNSRIPTFASCWGFQAMARAMGGRVVNDPSRAEVGTHHLFLTEAGRTDPVLSPLGDSFEAQMGHEDCVVELPPGTTLLASSKRHEFQAYRFDDRPIYCTQFHPELNDDDIRQHIREYPTYVERIAQMPLDEFMATIRDTSEMESVLRRFVEIWT